MLDERISPKIINSTLTEEARAEQLDFALDKFHISSKIVLTSKCQVRHRVAQHNNYIHTREDRNS